MNLWVIIKDEKGRPSKKVIPPRTTVEVTVQGSFQEPVLVFSSISWAKRSVFVVPRPYMGSVILVYNGGLETQWLEDGDVVAEY